MKRKNLLTLALAGVLSLSLCVPALADDIPEWSDERAVAEWADPSQAWSDPSEWIDAGETVSPEWSDAGQLVYPEGFVPSEDWTEDEVRYHLAGWTEPLEFSDPWSDGAPAESTDPEAPVQPAAPWYAEAQQYVMDRGIMSGTPEGFDPEGTVTRVVAFHTLWNMEGKPAGQDAAPFSDVPLGCWYQDSASWAREAGVIQGDGDGTYNPQWTISRAELATAFYRYAQFKELDVTAVNESVYLSYSDALSVPDYASDALRWAVDRGIINGKIQNWIPCLDANGAITRAELATMLMRLDKLLKAAA